MSIGGCVDFVEAMKQLISKEPMRNTAINFPFLLFNDRFGNLPPQAESFAVVNKTCETLFYHKKHGTVSVSNKSVEGVPRARYAPDEYVLSHNISFTVYMINTNTHQG